MEGFSDNDKKVLEPFFTNLEGNVFVLRNLPEVVKGALFSRYSRSPDGLRRILLDEFINKEEMQFSDIVSENETDKQIIATQKAEKFYDRVLVGYGDDSVAELGGAHIACEGISNIATKILEDARIGISPLEKSSRYVLFNDTVNGKYKYYRDPKLMQSEFADLYVRTCDMLFDVYTELMSPLKAYLKSKTKKDDEVSQRAYENSINAKACDILRGLLPASTLTNVGMFGNGRAFEYLLMKMRTSELTEIRHLAEKMQHELSKVIPSFVKRVYSKHGDEFCSFIESRDKDIMSLPVKIDVEDDAKRNSVELIDFNKDAENKIVSFIIYEYTGKPLADIMENVRMMPYLQKADIINSYVKHRDNRRHKPGRAFENVSYTFDIVANFGAFRDLQRHRILTQFKQKLNTDNGYDMPSELEDAGLSDDFIVAMEKAKEAFDKIKERYPDQAQYVVPFGYKIRWYFTLNLREAYHLCELRSGRQGHIDYRRIAQDIYALIKEKHPLLVKHMRYVDMHDYDLERLDAEKRIDKKMEYIKRKWGTDNHVK